MNDYKNDKLISSKTCSRTVSQVGFYSAVVTVILTLISFGFAMTAVPISGANCPSDCVTYPYLNTVAQYPKDFLWMPFAMSMILAYVILMVSIHVSIPNNMGIFSLIGLAFALISAGILISDYFLQFTVIPTSLANNEMDGLAMLIQYNPHGIFIALEELGYLLMSLSFLFFGFVFTNKNRLSSAIRWIFIMSFVLVIFSFVLISFIFGIERLDRFEVVAISVNWLALIVNGVLLGILFRRQLIAEENK